MSFRQTARDGAAIGGAWLFGIALVLVAVIIGVLTWANIAPWATEKQREINHESQQYQDAQVDRARNLLDGIMIADDKGQKKLLIRRFCSTLENIDDLPDDLAAGSAKYC
jgi:nitrogen fixation-related uncharacterized protein